MHKLTITTHKLEMWRIPPARKTHCSGSTYIVYTPLRMAYKPGPQDSTNVVGGRVNLCIVWAGSRKWPEESLIYPLHEGCPKQRPCAPPSRPMQGTQNSTHIIRAQPSHFEPKLMRYLQSAVFWNFSLDQSGPCTAALCATMFCWYHPVIQQIVNFKINLE